MRLIERLKPAMLRWDRLLALLALALPILATLFAGFAWMVEHGWLVDFIVGSIALGGVVAAARLAARHLGRAPAPLDPATRLHARTGRDWGPAETRAFAAALEVIDRELAAPRPWEELQPLAMQLIATVAENSGEGGRKGRGKGPLDFTLPEALLLVERVAARFRTDLRGHVPFADTISVATLSWLWQHREMGLQAMRTGRNAWRILRAVKSLPIAILREIEGAIAEGHSNFVTGEGTVVLQALLMEEVAAAAVELYSGRLRFSDSELLQLALADGARDAARLAEADVPLRIGIAGQVSAGKSSLVNALLGVEAAETDVITTTARPTAHPFEIAGTACMALDLPGLDGSARMTEAVLEALDSCDLVLWVIRANRPAREIDRRVLAEMRARLTADPARRLPQVIPVISCIDTLTEGWPRPEHALDAAAIDRVAAIVAEVSADIALGGAVPVVLTSPEWNLGSLANRLEAGLGEALMVQRNRLRLERAGGLRQEAVRAGRGILQGAQLFGARLRRARGETPEEREP